MKTLYLVRHAKSSRDDPTLPDRDRPLEARGERDAARMSWRLSQRPAKPELILSSPALRALATAKVMAEALDGRAKDIVVDDRLYAATADALTAVIEQLDDRLKRVMLVGHNPGLTELAHRFSGDVTHMPTCAIAVFVFDAATWRGIGQARPAQSNLDFPKLTPG